MVPGRTSDASRKQKSTIVTNGQLRQCLDNHLFNLKFRPGSMLNNMRELAKLSDFGTFPSCDNSGPHHEYYWSTKI